MDNSAFYKTELFVDEFDDDLKCAICYTYVVRDTQVLHCVHSFCKVCLDGIYKLPESQHKCPTCRSTLPEQTKLVSNPTVNFMIEKMHILCPNTSLGCEKIMYLGKNGQYASKHVTTECLYTPRNCEHCSESVSTCRYLLHLEQECKHRLVKCFVCNESMKCLDMKEHRSNDLGCANCTRCPNKCLLCGIVQTKSGCLFNCDKCEIFEECAYTPNIVKTKRKIVDDEAVRMIGQKSESGAFIKVDTSTKQDPCNDMHVEENVSINSNSSNNNTASPSKKKPPPIKSSMNRILIKDLESHLLVCKKQMITCSLCQESFLRKDEHKHFPLCTHQVLDCAACLQTFIRKDKEKHFFVCQNQEIVCGICSLNFIRRDEKVHNETKEHRESRMLNIERLNVKQQTNFENMLLDQSKQFDNRLNELKSIILDLELKYKALKEQKEEELTFSVDFKQECTIEVDTNQIGSNLYGENFSTGGYSFRLCVQKKISGKYWFGVINKGKPFKANFMISPKHYETNEAVGIILHKGIEFIDLDKGMGSEETLQRWQEMKVGSVNALTNKITFTLYFVLKIKPIWMK